MKDIRVGANHTHHVYIALTFLGVLLLASALVSFANAQTHVATVKIGGSSASADAPYAADPTISITTTNGATVCPDSLNGTWSGTAPYTCTVSGTLIIAGETTLDIGTINNYVQIIATGGNGGSPVFGDGGDGGTGIDNYGTINNYGTIAGGGGNGGDPLLRRAGRRRHRHRQLRQHQQLWDNRRWWRQRRHPGVGIGGIGGTGIDNYGNINSYGTINGTGGSAGNTEQTYDDGVNGGTGIYNSGNIASNGTIGGLGGTGGCAGEDDNGDVANIGIGGTGIYNTYIITYEGAITGTGGAGGGDPTVYCVSQTGYRGAGIDNGVDITTYGLGIYNYCGPTQTYSSYYGTPTNLISCYTVTFDQSGIPSGVTWGVTVSWGPFLLPVDHTGTGGSIAISAAQPITFSYDSPVNAAGVTYVCQSEFCSVAGDPFLFGDTTFTATYSSTSSSTTTTTTSPPTEVPQFPLGLALLFVLLPALLVIRKRAVSFQRISLEASNAYLHVSDLL